MELAKAVEAIKQLHCIGRDHPELNRLMDKASEVVLKYHVNVEPPKDPRGATLVDAMTDAPMIAVQANGKPTAYISNGRRITIGAAEPLPDPVLSKGNGRLSDVDKAKAAKIPHSKIMTEKEWLTVNEAAAALGFSNAAIGDWCRSGRIEATWNGGRHNTHGLTKWLINTSEIERFKREGKAKPVKGPPNLDEPGKEWLTREEFAYATGRSMDSIGDWCRQGRINARQGAGYRNPGLPRWTISRTELARYLEKGLLPHCPCRNKPSLATSGPY